MATHARVTIVKDNVSDVFKGIQDLVRQQVLIGIPEKTVARDDEEGDLNNATIGYLMETGSPANNVPARPFLVPGVKKATPAALKQLRAAADAALSGNTTVMDQRLNAAGIVGMNSVVDTIGSNIPPPLAPSTIRGRKYARGTASRRDNEKQYLDLIRKGATPAAAQSAANIVALVNTSQLLNSITYVVRKKA